MGENMSDERVQRYAEAIWGKGSRSMLRADAVMAVADAEQAELRAGLAEVNADIHHLERALADERAKVERLELRGSYDLSMMQCRAETAEARLARVEALVTKSDGTYVNSYTTIQAVAIIAALAGESGMVGS